MIRWITQCPRRALPSKNFSNARGSSNTAFLPGKAVPNVYLGLTTTGNAISSATFASSSADSGQKVGGIRILLSMQSRAVFHLSRNASQSSVLGQQEMKSFERASWLRLRNSE